MALSSLLVFVCCDTFEDYLLMGGVGVEQPGRVSTRMIWFWVHLYT